MTDEERIKELEQQKKMKLLEKEIVEAEQAVAKARREEAAATATAERDAAKAAAENDKAIAEAEEEAAKSRRDLAAGDEVAARDKAKADAEAKKAIVEANATALKAVLPGEAKLQPLEGDIATDEKAGHVAEVVAHSLVTSAAADLAKKLAPGVKNKRILVVEERDLAASDWAYQVVSARIKLATDELKALNAVLPQNSEQISGTSADQPEARAAVGVPPAVVAAGGAAIVIKSLVGAAADVVGYVRSDYTIKGRSVSAQYAPLVSALTAALRQEDKENKEDSSSSVVLDRFRPLPETSPTLAQFKEIGELRWAVTRAKFELQAGDLAKAAAAVSDATKAKTSAIAKVTALPVDTKLSDRQEAESGAQVAGENLFAAETKHDALKGLVELATAAEARADALITELTKVPEAGGLPPLGLAVLREVIHGSEAVDAVLVASIDAIGGETITRKNRLLGPAIRYVGSCQVSALLVATKVAGRCREPAVGDILASASAGFVGNISLNPRSGKYTELKSKQIN